jgi:hypothetical protein
LSEFTPYVRLPHTLTVDKPSVVASGSIDDDQFAAHQVEFVRQLFGYCTYLREPMLSWQCSLCYLKFSN